MQATRQKGKVLQRRLVILHRYYKFACHQTSLHPLFYKAFRISSVFDFVKYQNGCAGPQPMYRPVSAAKPSYLFCKSSHFSSYVRIKSTSPFVSSLNSLFCLALRHAAALSLACFYSLEDVSLRAVVRLGQAGEELGVPKPIGHIPAIKPSRFGPELVFSQSHSIISDVFIARRRPSC